MSDTAATAGEEKTSGRGVRPRLTPRGRGLIAISVMAVMYGFFTPEPRAVHLGLLGLLVLGGSFLWTGRNLRDLTCVRTAPESAFAGQLFLLTLTVANHRKRMDAFAVDFEDAVAGPFEKGLRVDWLQAGGSATRDMQSRVSRRGTLHRAHSSFESMFPLGLWKTRVELDNPLAMTVFPRPVTPKMFEDPDVLTLLEEDETESVMAHWDGDFHGLREFQPGDRMKLIHWPTSARSRHLIVRQFDRRLPTRVTLIFHSIRPDAKPQPGGAFESGLELLCGMLLLFRDRGTPVDMIASFNEWKTLQVETDEQLDGALRTLATAKRTPDRNCNALHAALAGVGPEDRVIVLSDVPLNEWESDMVELPCVTICLSVREMYVRQPRTAPMKPVPIVQV